MVSGNYPAITLFFRFSSSCLAAGGLPGIIQRLSGVGLGKIPLFGSRW